MITRASLLRLFSYSSDQNYHEQPPLHNLIIAEKRARKAEDKVLCFAPEISFLDGHLNERNLLTILVLYDIIKFGSAFIN